MKYIKKFEKSEADILRSKYVGKYIIFKSTPYDLTFFQPDVYKEMYFLIYFIPGTSDGYMYRTYTSIIVGFKDDDKTTITVDEEIIKNIYKSSVDHTLIKHLNLSETDKISLYVTTKYKKAIEMLNIIDDINKYNL